jgi:butirosin biosynthesis protein H-like/uncharacterized protein DUF4872
MTDRKHLKSRVRARMERTGERYAAARAQVVAARDQTPTALKPSDTHAAPTDQGPGANPGASALRTVLADAGLPLTEAHALVIGGGIGIGVFQFHYAAEGVGTFFIAGRHRWDDDLAFLEGGLRRLGLEPTVTETGSTKAADRQVRDALDTGRTVVAWVDSAVLGTRALPVEWDGGGYHVVVVRAIDDARGVAVIDDLAQVPLEVPLEVFARARARIAKQKNRLLWLGADATTPGVDVVRSADLAGLRATVDAFDHPRSRQFSLEALADWSARIRGGGRDSWSTVFPTGDGLWSALASVNDFIRGYGSGGGLMRSLFGQGVTEVAAGTGDDRLAALGRRYGGPGTDQTVADAWDAVAEAALPESDPAFRRTRELQHARAIAYRERGSAALPELRAAWDETVAIRGTMRDAFPLTPAETSRLLATLADAVDAVVRLERDALDALRGAIE